MRHLREVFLMVKRNAEIIQRAVRRYLARRDMIIERMREYLTQQYQVLANVTEMERFQLFGHGTEEENAGLVKIHTPYSARKVHIIQRVVDL